MILAYIFCIYKMWMKTSPYTDLRSPPVEKTDERRRAAKGMWLEGQINRCKI